MHPSSRILWTVALVITLISAVWQRWTGPTYPVRGTVSLGGTEIRLRLDRSQGGPGDQPVTVVVPDRSVTGQVTWRPYPSAEGWQTLPMRRAGDTLGASLPHQPPAGKLEYQVRLTRGAETAVFPARPAVTRFKGDVAPAILVPHVLTMFLGMLWSTRAGLAALFGGDVRRSTLITVLLLGIGGVVLGPAVQKQAFGEWWTGVPYGYDLTDNKTLIAGVAWLWAAWRVWRNPSARGSVVAASLVTLAVFAIPHSLWGSELKR